MADILAPWLDFLDALRIIKLWTSFYYSMNDELYAA